VQSKRNQLVNRGIKVVDRMSESEKMGFYERFAARYRDQRRQGALPADLERFEEEDAIFERLPPEMQQAANQDLFDSLQKRFQPLAL
jgi:hypothetical protein